MMSYLKKHHLALTLLLAVFVLVPQTTHAQVSGSSAATPTIDVEELAQERAGASESSGLFSLGGLAFDIVGGLLSPVAVGLVKLVSYITMLSGVVLNASVYYTVTNMAKSLNDLPALNIAWTTIRDLANMGFIFMLLSASIMTIIGKEKDARGIVVKMVIAAILINFSLFFTKVIIDVANLLALTFYSATAPGAGSDFLSSGLSNNIIQALGAQTLWESAGNLDGSTVFNAAILSSITLLVTAFVFAAMAVMFLVRYVVLIFVLILSPLMVLSSVFPALKDYSKKWWDALLNQAFFAPVFFILMWVTLTLVKGISDKVFIPVTGSSLANGLNPSSISVGGVSMLINYAVILGFIVATLVISKSIADKASPMAASLNKWALGKAGGATLGLAGRVGRGTVGRAGAALGDREDLKRAAEKGGVGGMAARLALVAGRKTAGASFDVRGMEAAGTLGAGKAETGGYTAYIKKKSEEEEKFASSLAPSTKIKAQATASAKQTEEAYKEAVKKYGEDSDQAKSAKIEMDEAKKYKDTIHGNKDEVEASVKDLDNKMKKEVNDLNNSEELKAKEIEERSAYDTVSRLEAEVVAAEGSVRDEKIVQLAAAKEKLKEIKTEAGIIRQKIKTETENITRKYDEEKKKLKETTIDPAGDTRKKSFAKATENSKWAKAMGYNYEAAAKIRKGNKKAEELVKDLMKATGEVKDEKKDEGFAEEKDKK